MIYKIVENSVIYTIKNNNQQNHRTTMPLAGKAHAKKTPAGWTGLGLSAAVMRMGGPMRQVPGQLSHAANAGNKNPAVLSHGGVNLKMRGLGDRRHRARAGNLLCGVTLLQQVTRGGGANRLCEDKTEQFLIVGRCERHGAILQI